jgi:hypothetical protein
MNGLYNEMTYFNGVNETVQDILKHYDELGDRTQCCAFSADEGADVGADEGTPVTEAYKVPFKFTGKIAKVTIELGEMKTADRHEADHARNFATLKKGLAD